MKKIIIIINFLLLAFVFIYFYNKHSYAVQNSYFTVKSHIKSHNLKIGIIGDSWVVRQKLDSLVNIKLIEKGHRIDLFSFGNPGAKTKLIYENLFKEKDQNFSSREIIEKQPDYCIVIAGVNDAAMNLGPEYYAHHMIMIIKTLIHYNIVPIVVTLPEFGLEENFKKMNIISQFSNKMANVFLNNGNAFEIDDYRIRLLKELKINRLDNKVEIINFDEFCKDYNKNKDLYSDPLHLNRIGYDRFSEFLAEKLKNKK